MSLNDDLASDAAVFVSTDDFGESVVWTPKGGTPRTISAVVVRDPAERISPDGDVKRPKMDIHIRNHATLGASSIDSGGDTVTVAYRKGGTAQTFHISAPEKQDAGMWLVTVW